MQTNRLWQLMPDRIKHKICRTGNESEHAAESKEAVANNRMAIIFIDQIIATLKTVSQLTTTLQSQQFKEPLEKVDIVDIRHTYVAFVYCRMSTMCNLGNQSTTPPSSKYHTSPYKVPYHLFKVPHHPIQITLLHSTEYHSTLFKVPHRSLSSMYHPTLFNIPHNPLQCTPSSKHHSL